ncbi:MAG: hypothetical protein PHX10_04655 [Gallionellaceae bacterium]|nr:hypothetical protein [Gallionellaceae bacterium]
MAIPWFLLKTVPWADVIATAPVVADGAKKLWNAVAGKPAPVQVQAETPAVSAAPEAEAVALVQARLVAIEATVSELHRQMLASSELIKALADQNAELIKRAEANRIRLLWLYGVAMMLGVLATMALALALANYFG